MHPGYPAYRHEVDQLKSHMKTQLLTYIGRRPQIDALQTVSALAEVFAEAGVLFLSHKTTIDIVGEIREMLKGQMTLVDPGPNSGGHVRQAGVNSGVA